MKNLKFTLLFFILINTVVFAESVTRYVSPDGSNTAPYTSWATAATNIQSAIDQSTDSDLVLVGDGTYVISSSIILTKAIIVQSQNGPSHTVIDGNNAVLCIYINNTNAVVDGFTITKGYNPNGFGGGVNIVSGGTIQNCIITNSQARDGGGVAIDNSGLVQNCIIKGNKASNNSGNGYGGGVRMLSGGITRGCLVYGNTSVDLGGGINIWDAGTIQNCTVANNTAPNGAGVRCRGNSVMQNTISYFNNGSNWATEGSSCSFSNNCTTPDLPSGTGNITGDPLFVDEGLENFNLLPSSPCIDAGLNDTWMTSAKDLNGNNRIFSTAVDMGAYEFTIFSISATAGTGGSISPAGAILVSYGSSQTFNITSNSGYKIVDVVVDGVSKGVVSTYTFTNVNANHTILAKFDVLISSDIPTVPIISYPTNGITVYSLSTMLCWYIQGSSTGLTFRIKYSTDPNNTNANGDLKTIDVGNVLSYWINDLQWGKNYYWQVMSISSAGSSNYSSIASFSVITNSTVITPEVPIPAWPTGGAIVYLSSQYLTWYTLSGGANIASYIVKWGEGSVLNNVISGITTLTVQITGLLPGHTYSWQVESVDKQGNHSLPCTPVSFTTAGGTGNKPSTPVQAWPIGGEIVYMTSPTSIWYMANPGFGIREFIVKYSKNSSMSGATEVHVPGTMYTATLNNLEKGATYYWQVQTSDGHVLSDPQSPPASFSIYTDTYSSPSAAPMALSPIGGIGINSSSIVFGWTSASKDLTYNLQYSTDESFSNPVEIKNLDQNLYKADKLTNSTYYWRVQSKTKDGMISEYSPAGKFYIKGITGVADKKMDVDGFSLLQNYPNPFNPSTLIQFNLPNESYVTVEVFNSIGESVGKLFEGPKPKGISTVQFNAENLPSGLYLYKITAVDLTGNVNFDARKMLLLK